MKVDKKININAVKMMRDIREKLSKKYNKNIEQEKQELKKIRQKHRLSVQKESV